MGKLPLECTEHAGKLQLLISARAIIRNLMGLKVSKRLLLI